MKAHVLSEDVNFELQNGCANITLNRPAAGNALSSAMVDALDAAIDQALGAGARMMVFRGSGNHLCTGFDLGDLESSSDGDLLLRFVRIEQVLQRVYGCPVATVAVGSGRVYGAGADLFAACDRRISLPEASFAFPGSAFGLILGTRRLGTRIGNDTARRILIAGQVISANEAVRIGLATDFCEEDKLSNLLTGIMEGACRLPSRTVAILHAATSFRDDDADLAALVNSASVPGLNERISAYREKVSRERAKA